ncbi:hypothetical protein C2S53_019282 [Perilla frutescens var. hirtella]|uniref:Uncharacterized protein n=1 Tax=Perilla frutescens var. hirtella TaxID=608512 RepID=A0AAD4IZ75_PERFH|nr:hypothetical protein C2S53_019282 [Perilla frutescens var. hirtella]
MQISSEEASIGSVLSEINSRNQIVIKFQELSICSWRKGSLISAEELANPNS